MSGKKQPLKGLIAGLDPTTKVLLVTGAMVALAAGLMLTLGGDLLDGGLAPAIPFALAFMLAESIVFHIEIRKQAHTFSIGEAVMVIGLFAVGPLPLLLARVVGGGVALAVIRRSQAVKVIFNAGMFALECAVALRVFGLFGQAADVSLWRGAGAILATAAADTVTVVAVFTAITIFEGTPRRRHVIDVFNAQMMVTVIAGSVGVVGVGALEAGAWQTMFLAVVGSGMVAVFRQHATVTSRYSGLQTLHDFSRTIANDVDVDRVLRTAMTDVVDVIAATNVAVIATQPGSFGPAGLYWMNDGHLEHTDLPVSTLEVWRDLRTQEPVLRDAIDVPGPALTSLSVEDGQVLSVELRLGDDEAVVFVATKSAAAVGSFDKDSADQVGALARQLSATLRNGLFVRHLDEASRRDELTGLSNRAEFVETLDALPEGQTCSVLVLGMVAFDVVNETLGHAVGDSMLRETARRLRDALGDHAFAIARLNGATFAVALPGDAADRVRRLARLAIDAVAQADPHSAVQLDMRCRAGLVETSPIDPVESAVLVRHGDLALAEANRSGRLIAEYTEDLDETQRRRVQLIAELRVAIERNDFELWFQPKIDMHAGSVIGAEALIRWIHDDLGFIPPDEFIGLAETAGLVGDITTHVLEMAAAEARRWLDKGEPIKIAVNLSAHDLTDPDLPGRLADLLERHGITTDHIGLELTETAVVADGNRIIEVLGMLREMGFTLYVDDYGTGYSSLSYMRLLPIHALKIDQAFIRDLATSEHDDVIVRSTIDLAHSLGLTVVAEGVEDLGSYERLRELGCETAQGFFMARPMRPADFDEWMNDLPTLQALLGYGEDGSGSAESGSASQATAQPAGGTAGDATGRVSADG